MEKKVYSLVNKRYGDVYRDFDSREQAEAYFTEVLETHPWAIDVVKVVERTIYIN